MPTPRHWPYQIHSSPFSEKSELLSFSKNGNRSLPIVWVCTSLLAFRYSSFADAISGLAGSRVKLTNLPSKATLKHIVPLVWGGNIQESVYTDGQSWAEVVFVKPEQALPRLHSKRHRVSWFQGPPRRG
ncbi:hypothetical protein E2P81_ATG10820 [Venturia nashicola]|uniref:Uncharacterized protein n=1 Tax=Venturia nashicola TaxID=86259 RepID=A0A4Z1NSL2_9PEZI|nr:hypothetical protein E6O75_ATG10493 [Venturia nashicola]TLD27532.1 hypothetical protein E2P81_ATG10820 [Venturia nashicola]